MSATSYALKATNSTLHGWHVGLYQKQPVELGLKTIAWKVLSLSKPQPDPTMGTISWNLTYKVTVPQSGGGSTFVGGISMDAKMGYSYKLVLQDGYRQIVEEGPGTKGYINFKNSTDLLQNMGLMVDGSLMAMQQNVEGNVTAQFQVTPTYYCGLYNDITQGSFIKSDSAVDTVQICFPGGLTTASINAVIEDRKLIIKGPTYSP